MAELKLDILICTFAQRLEQIPSLNLPQIDGVRYVISCQNPQNLKLNPQKDLEIRSDVEIHYFNDKGLSINRNHALDLAKAEYLLIADDDLQYYASGIKQLIAEFDADTNLQIVTCRTKTPVDRIFPQNRHDLHIPVKAYYAISFEIAFRRTFINRYNLAFSTLAGIGAPYLGSGEEDLLLHHALATNAKAIHISALIASHPHPTTSENFGSHARVLRAKGAVIRIMRGNTNALIRFPIEAWRSQAPFAKALFCFLQGFCYSIKHRRQL